MEILKASLRIWAGLFFFSDHERLNLIFIYFFKYSYFEKCIIVSKGNSSHLMKATAKRRRTKEEVKEHKRVEANAQAELARRLVQI